MEPIPETHEAIEQLERMNEASTLLRDLQEQTREVRDIVPDCLGLSLASIEHDVTFTLVASSDDVAVLDAIQYLAGGPCVAAAKADRVLEFDREGMLDEGAWHLFASATAAYGVASTLTLPIIVDGRVTGTVNLYGGSRRAFVGHHEALADLFSAWAPGAVANADLSFRTREEAKRAPERIRRRVRIDTALGILAASRGIDVQQARADLAEAARRAGVELADLAAALIELRNSRDLGD